MAVKNINESNIISASINLVNDNLTDRYYLETTESCNISDAFQGTVGNFSFNIEEVEIEENITANGSTFSVSNASNLSDKFNNELNLSPANLKLKTLLNSANISYDLDCDFTLDDEEINATVSINRIEVENPTEEDLNNVSVSFALYGQNKKSYVDSLLVWSSNFFDRKMYCVERNNSLYVTSLNKIKRTYSADDFCIQNASISKKKLRLKTEDKNTTTEFNSKETYVGASNMQTFYEEKDLKFSGTFSFGGASLTYSDGLLTREITNGVTTTYSYSNGLISNKATTYQNTKDGDVTSTSISYSYDKFMGETYICGEYETSNKVKESDDGALIPYRANDKSTQWYPLGNGMFGQSVSSYEYDETGATVSKDCTSGITGAGTGEASIFTIKGYVWGWRKKKKDDETTTKTPDVTVQGRPTQSVSCPIVEKEAFTDWMNYYYSFNKKIEETLNCTIISADIIDPVNSVFLFRGNTYYIQSNSISQSEMGITQRISCVRWY